jgi:NTE family protein
METAQLLRNVPLLAGLSQKLLERVAKEVEVSEVRGGEWLMREGESAESVFIVRSGRLDVVDEGPPETLIRVLRRGEIVGELALLRAGERSVSVRARRDSELLVLGRTAFEALIEEAPSFALGLTRALGAELAASRTPMIVESPPRTIAVVGLDRGAPVAEVAQGLADALAAHGSIAALAQGDLATLDQAERDCDRVLLRGGAELDEWTALCLREADRVVAVTTEQPSATSLGQPALKGCELFVAASGVDAGVIAALQPREVQVVQNTERRDQAVEGLARRLAGRSLGLVLSGGGARALAHLGVLEELYAAGLRFDRIGGVSLGALIGASTATDVGAEAVYEVFARSMATNPTNDWSFPAFSLIRGAKTRKLIEDAFGDRRIEELPLRFFSVSCDLIARESVVHRSGPVADAVYPSLAIPGIFPPVATPDGRLLVDGGVLDNLPVETMAKRGEGPVIAVDVTGRMGDFKRPRRPRLARVGGRVRRALTGSEAQIPRLGETIVRTLTVGSCDTVAAARLHADLVIAPRLEGVGLMDWDAISRVREIGRRAARECLAADPDRASRLVN